MSDINEEIKINIKEGIERACICICARGVHAEGNVFREGGLVWVSRDRRLDGSFAGRCMQGERGTGGEWRNLGFGGVRIGAYGKLNEDRLDFFLFGCGEHLLR